MLISTMNDLPGYRIEAVFGDVFGTVHSRRVENLAESRLEAIERLTSAAAAMGADAVVSIASTSQRDSGQCISPCPWSLGTRAFPGD